MAEQKTPWEKAADIVKDAGGELIGRTRLQKVAYLLELTGLGEGFEFSYRQFGPYSEDLAEAIDVAQAFHLIEEKEQIASWGGRFSVFTCKDVVQSQEQSQRVQFIRAAVGQSALALELVATATYLKAVEGYSDPWEETKKRKPTKTSEERLHSAHLVYQLLHKIDTPKKLPELLSENTLG
jgi:uncharacterized protein YwgA